LVSNNVNFHETHPQSSRVARLSIMMLLHFGISKLKNIHLFLVG
jgi:hypothetical protein